MALEPLPVERVARAKPAYTTRLVRPESLGTLLHGDHRPAPGDIVLARVDELGQHRYIERPDGRRAALFPGDDILVCYANRYAPDQFEAVVPVDLSPCHLVAAGGVAGLVQSRHARLGEPTRLTPLGLIGDRDGRRVNLRQWALPPAQPTEVLPPILAVVGTAMNAGKTTTAAGIVRGLVAAGLIVGAAKVTGTGAGRDAWLLQDAGAATVLDFTTAGYPSTFRLPATEVTAILSTLVGHLALERIDAIVLEVADGVFQAETALLLADPLFARLVGGLVFAAGDALGVVAGVACLRERGLPVLAASGRLTASPLAVQEARAELDVPVLGPQELWEPAVATRLLAAASQPVPLHMAS